MRAIRLTLVSLAGCLLIAFTVRAQPWKEHWRKQTFSTFGYEATVLLPDGWSVQKEEIVWDTRPDCRIAFAPPARGNVEQMLARRLDEDRQHAASEMHSELSRAGGGPDGLKLVSVQYIDRGGRLNAKRYFEVPSQDGDTLMEWTLGASADADGRDCAARFSIVAGSFRITGAPAAAVDEAASQVP